jgi:tRNA pseudouridine13 synthase
LGGRIKTTPQDFFVEEVPLYAPSGDGTHIYFGIEKEGLTTPAAIRAIARALGCHNRAIGYAGMKDARAVTRQVLSLEHVDPARIEQLSIPHIRVLWVNRHTNKLKLGHLSGNRFGIRIRDVHPSSVDRAGPILEQLTSSGVPNYFGPQRFGVAGNNAMVGGAALVGDYVTALQALVCTTGPNDTDTCHQARAQFEAGAYAEAGSLFPHGYREQIQVCRSLARRPDDAQAAFYGLDSRQRRLYLSALQSALFNHVVARRMPDMGHLLAGDLAWKHANGACFKVDAPGDEQARADQFEISPAGPLFGHKMRETDAVVGEIERGVLESAGLTPQAFRSRLGKQMDGARRPFRVPLGDPAVDEGSDSDGPYLELRFALPRGSYATSVTAELCRAPS